jgi:adenine phosphoribosyltransferase
MSRAPKVVELGPAHFCYDQTDEAVQYIAKHLPWYGPKYSPHDVPNFYDISGICEDPTAFQSVCAPLPTGTDDMCTTHADA